jgi:hypothetical protein
VRHQFSIIRVQLAFCISACLFCGNGLRAAEQFHDWDRTDYVLLGAALTTIAIDWGQTRYIARHPQTYHEINPILGKHPSVGKVDRYFAASMLGTVGIAMVLPTTYRKYWLGGVAVFELGFIIHNKNLGIKVDF